MPVLSDVDALFQLPLVEFTAARNALAASLGAAGRTKDASAVKALPKPSLSAWTVNQLYWRQRKTFDRLVAVGTRLRNAQASRGAGRGSKLRAPLEAHRAALGEATRHAAALLRSEGHDPKQVLTRRIATTLEAIGCFGGQSSVPNGRLTRDVDPPGFQALAALVPRRGHGLRSTGRSRVIPFRQRAEPSRPKKLDAAGRREHQDARKAQATAAAATLRDAERALRNARQAAAHAESALRVAAARVKVAEKTRTTLKMRLEKSAARTDAARQAARRVAAAAEEAAQAIADAERTRAEARRALDALS